MPSSANELKLVMTLLVRDEEDILEDNIWYHYHQGVDAFIVMDNLSTDSTPQILRNLSELLPIEYLQQKEDNYDQSIWVTQMARIAYERYGADWVINNDADEFWSFPKGSLKDALRTLPASVGAVNVPRVNALPLFDQEPASAVAHPRRSVLFEVSSTNSLGRPLPSKCFHRASAEAIVSQGNHSVSGVSGDTVDGAGFLIYHYPYRALPRYSQRIAHGGQAYARNTTLPPEIGSTWRSGYLDLQAGALPDFWRRIALSHRDAELGWLRGRLRRDTTIVEALGSADAIRGRLIRRQAHSKWVDQTRCVVREKQQSVLKKINQFSEADLPGRPLYQNLEFFLQGPRKHQEAVSLIGAERDCHVELSVLRDIVSLLPENAGAVDFARASFCAEAPTDARNLSQDIAGKRVILHISCEKYFQRAEFSLRSFASAGNDGVVHIVVVGCRENGEASPSGWALSYNDGVLKLPVPDSYEALHKKVFHALFVLECLGPVSSVVKIDDSLHLADSALFIDTIEAAVAAEAACTGRIVGALRHDEQWHGWHLGKCTDKRCEQRGYSYPLPRQYPAGGYGYILTRDGISACAAMYLSMKEFFSMSAVGLEDVFIGHALYARNLELRDVSSEDHLLALPGLRANV